MQAIDPDKRNAFTSFRAHLRGLSIALPSKGMMRFLGLLVLTLISQAACKKKSNNGDDGYSPTELGKVQVWISCGDKTKLLSQQADLPILNEANDAFALIEIDTVQKFQKVEGYGAALTGSSAYVLNQKLSTSSRNQVLHDLFDTISGIGISYLRLTMGASDFSLKDFTYDDMPNGSTDYPLQHFDLGADKDDLIPVLKQIKAIQPGIRLLGTPWSAPAWMKSVYTLKGSKLRAECFGVYARYFARYIQAMQSEGIAISAITPQNEPLYYTASYPCMQMTAADQALFIKSALGPTLDSAGLKTKIICYDHNWDHPEYPNTVLADASAAQYTAGSAFHAYAGDVSAMGEVHQSHPDKELYFTEISGGGWATNFSDNLMWNMKYIFIGTAMNWSQTALLWNLALDQTNGPQNGGCADCRGVVTINTTSGTVQKNEEYYALAHFSKFVRPGSYRILATVPTTLNINAVAFIRPDGKKVLVAQNESAAGISFMVKQHIGRFTAFVPAKSVVTFVW